MSVEPLEGHSSFFLNLKDLLLKQRLLYDTIMESDECRAVFRPNLKLNVSTGGESSIQKETQQLPF